MRPVTFFAALLMLAAGPARADSTHGGPPTLSDFLAGARKNNPTRRVSQADLINAQVASAEALAAVLPSLNGTGDYIYNQYSAVLPPGSFGPGTPSVVLSPYDQETANLSLKIPLFDGPGLAKWRAARIAATASQADDLANERDLELSVATAYYAAIAAQELVLVAEKTSQAAQENLKTVNTRLAAGAVTPLFAERAELEISRDDQTLIDARRAFQVARRTLASLSGLPEPDSLSEPVDDLSTVDAEASWQQLALAHRPELAGLRNRLEVAALSRKTSWLQYTPTIFAKDTEFFTNASGFTGKSYYNVATVEADWLLIEFGQRAGESRKAKAEEMRAQANLESKRTAVIDEVHSSWLQLDADIAKLVAARRGAEVGRKAAAEMRTRFGAGASTQLEVIQSDRDWLTAEVDRIRAEADLALARLALQKAAGLDLK